MTQCLKGEGLHHCDVAHVFLQKSIKPFMPSVFIKGLQLYYMVVTYLRTGLAIGFSREEETSRALVEEKQGIYNSFPTSSPEAQMALSEVTPSPREPVRLSHTLRAASQRLSVQGRRKGTWAFASDG